jgi:DNA-binding NtrC family response regulator
MKHILLVDDEPNVLLALRRVLERAFGEEPVAIEAFASPLEALGRAQYMRYEVVVSDFRMPGMDGVTFLKAMRSLQPDSVRLILSATTDFQAVMTAVNQAEIHRYLVKPWSRDELVDTVRESLERFDRLLEDRLLADEKRVERGRLSAEERERRRLEAESPGITKVTWGPDGELLLDDL